MNTSDVRRTGRVERYDTIVIGAGQAGLAMGYYLSKHDADFLIVDEAAQVGDSWRKRWDSLRLFTPAAYSNLPGMPFPAVRAHVPDKDVVADYLERYAQRFDLPVRLNTRVASLHWNGHHYVVDARAIHYEARHIVIATGSSRAGFTPELSWIRMPLVLDGDTPRTLHGAAVGVPGLYFVGLRFQHSMTSSLLGGVSADAEQIATQILRAETN